MMQRPLARLLALALVACACGEDKAPPPPPTPTPVTVPAKPACAGPQKDFGDWTRALLAEPEGGGAPPAGVVARSEMGDPLPFGFVSVAVKKDAVLIDGAPAKDVKAALAALLKDRVQAARTAGDPTAAQPGLVVIAAADAPWAQVVTATSAAAGLGYARLGFLFARTTPVALPATAWVDSEEIEWKRHQAAGEGDVASPADAQMTARIDQALAPCPGAKELYGKARDAKPADRPALLAGMPAAVEACGCGVDFEAMKGVLWRLHTPARVSVVSLALADKGDEVSAAPDAPWSVTSQLVITAAAAGKPVRVSVAKPPAHP